MQYIANKSKPLGRRVGPNGVQYAPVFVYAGGYGELAVAQNKILGCLDVELVSAFGMWLIRTWCSLPEQWLIPHSGKLRF